MMKIGLMILLVCGLLILSAPLFGGGKKEKAEVQEQAAAEESAPESAAGADGMESSEIGTDENLAAMVNGNAITLEDIELGLMRFKQQLASSGRPVLEEQNAELRAVVLDGLVNRVLLFQESEVRGFRIEDQVVEERILEIRGQFPDEEQFNEALASQGITEEDLRYDLLTGLSIQQLLEAEVFPAVSVSDEEILRFYNENSGQFMQPEMIQASHILIVLEPGSDEETRGEAFRKIGEIQTLLNNGSDFADLAREYSEGPSSVQGGDLGYFGRGQMVPPFETAAFDLQVGQVSDVVETQFGLHLIKLFDRKEEEIIAFETVERDIEDYLYQLSTNTAVEDYTAGLRANAQITIF